MENNLKAVVNRIEKAVRNVDKTIGNFFYGDIYNINHIQEIKYPAVVVTNSTHNATSDYITYYFNIFYVDRLTADKKNKLDVQSAATMTLKNTMQLVDENYLVNDSYELHTFEEKFNDVCAGAYINVGIRCPLELCDVEPIEEIIYLDKITLTQNGTVTAPFGRAYKEVTVDVQCENKDEYFRKIIEGRLDEPLIIPSGTTAIRQNAFEYLNNKGRTIDIVCPLVELPEGNRISIGGSAFRYAKIKKIIVPSDNRLNGTYIFANNTDLEELIWKTNSPAFYMCADCTNLKKVVFTGSSPIIPIYAFSNCTSLKLVDLSKCTSVANLSSVSAFNGVPTTCEFRIPAALYDEWINATNWAALYAQGYKFTAV